MLANSLIHEMVHDPKSPIDYMVPFMFNNEDARKPAPVFSCYLCFLDLTKVNEFEMSEEQELGSVLCFKTFIDFFLIRIVEDPMAENHDEEEHI